MVTTAPAISEQASVAAVPTLQQIQSLEAELLQYPQTDPPIIHHFAAGLYAREMRVSAGTVLTGKMHRQQHICVLSAGRVTVWTESGMRTVEAPFTFVAEPGTKRAMYAHTDAVWTTFHPTTETDLDRIEADVIVPNEQIENFRECRPCLGLQQR
jgi:quercetin dioxygenase-like cupin family protein